MTLYLPYKWKQSLKRLTKSLSIYLLVRDISTTAYKTNMKLFFFLALLVACSVSFISADTMNCLEGAAACANHQLVAHENGQTYCCPSDYTGIASSGSVVNGVHHEVCICHS